MHVRRGKFFLYIWDEKKAFDVYLFDLGLIFTRGERKKGILIKKFFVVKLRVILVVYTARRHEGRKMSH